MQETQYKYLDKVDSPDDLKRLRAGELTQYCAELRRFIIAQLSSNPGHLGSSLGVVELTVALHYVLNMPDDKLVWDVGRAIWLVSSSLSMRAVSADPSARSFW